MDDRMDDADRINPHWAANQDPERTGGPLRLGMAALQDAARLIETERLTAEVRAIWRRYEQHVAWAAAATKRGDAFRAQMTLQHALAELLRAMQLLGEPQNDPRGPKRPRPELKLIAGEHRAWADPCGAEHPMHAGPLGPDPRTDDDPTVVELPVLEARSPAVAAAEAKINLAWAVQDGRTADAYDAAIARIDAELAQVAALRAGGRR